MNSNSACVIADEKCLRMILDSSTNSHAVSSCIKTPSKELKYLILKNITKQTMTPFVNI